MIAHKLIFKSTDIDIIDLPWTGILKSRVDIVITGHKNSLKRVSALRLKNNIANIYIYIYIYNYNIALYL